MAKKNGKLASKEINSAGIALLIIFSFIIGCITGYLITLYC